MRSLHGLDRLGISFDDDRLVAHAGRHLPSTSTRRSVKPTGSRRKGLTTRGQSFRTRHRQASSHP